MTKTGEDSAPRDEPPRAKELERRLGGSSGAFEALALGRPETTAEWKRYSKSAPWVLKVNRGRRTLYYLLPREGRFEVTVILGKRAAAAALAGAVRTELRAAIREARPYVEGRSVRIAVESAEDIAEVEELLAVKLH